MFNHRRSSSVSVRLCEYSRPQGGAEYALPCSFSAGSSLRMRSACTRSDSAIFFAYHNRSSASLSGVMTAVALLALAGVVCIAGYTLVVFGPSPGGAALPIGDSGRSPSNQAGCECAVANAGSGIASTHCTVLAPDALPDDGLCSRGPLSVVGGSDFTDSGGFLR